MSEATPMTIEPAALDALLARVEAAEGAPAWNDPLNDDLHLVLGWTRELDHSVYNGKHPAPWEWTDPNGHYCAHHIEDATRSLDAALALCERMLPEASCYGFDKSPHEIVGYVSRNNVKTGHWHKEGYAKTPALALVAAMLKALIAQAAGPRSLSVPQEEPPPSRTPDPAGRLVSHHLDDVGCTKKRCIWPDCGCMPPTSTSAEREGGGGG